MPKACNEIVISCPREDVFAFLADPENDPQWRRGVLDLKRVSGNGIGARDAQSVKGPGGHRIPADVEITELIPGKAIAFKTVSGPVRARGRCQLDAADGGTRVRFELESDVKGVKRLLGPMAHKTMNNEVRQLASLKRIIEPADHGVQHCRYPISKRWELARRFLCARHPRQGSLLAHARLVANAIARYPSSWRGKRSPERTDGG
jgi:uncharacterized membrane protein